MKCFKQLTSSLFLLLVVIGFPAYAADVLTAPTAAPSSPGGAKPARVMAPTASMGLAPVKAPAIDCSWLRDRGSNPETFSMAKPLRQDSRLVVFPYSKDAIYPINATYSISISIEP
jgi:hypothetical protein